MSSAQEESVGGARIIGSNTVEASQEQDTTQAQPANERSSLPPRPTREPMRQRSKVWDHFEKITGEDGIVITAKCIHCDKVLCCASKKNGTSSLNFHKSSCIKNPENQQTSQFLLNLQSKTDDGSVGMGTLTAWKFDQLEIREGLVKMIILDELPFKFVEGEGFREYISKACPRFQIPSRWSVSRDCFQLYLNERSKLKSFMKTNCERICITTDTWTSLQKINYMCIIGHFYESTLRITTSMQICSSIFMNQLCAFQALYMLHLTHYLLRSVIYVLC
ncbi:hypothetical protein ACS0TY_017787 [Phlomoides rotata]